MIYIENLDFGYQKKREVFSGLNLSLTGGAYLWPAWKEWSR